MTYIGNLKLADNRQKYPFTKIRGEKTTLMLKLGVEADELEKMLSSKMYTNRKRRR